MAISFSDDFTGSNGSIVGRIPNNALGGSASKVWTNQGNSCSITDNRFKTHGSVSIGLLDAPEVIGIRAKIFLPASGGRPALIAHSASTGLGPSIFLYLSTSYDSLHLRQTNEGDIYGSNVDDDSFSAISGNAEYVMELLQEGSVYTGRLYQSDGVTEIGSVSFDFTSTTFSSTYWGLTNYDGTDIEADDAIFYSADSGDPPEITTTSLADGNLNTPYNQTIEAISDSPITWSVSAGSLPTGLSLDAETGVIGGTPIVESTFNFTIQASNSFGSDTQAFTVEITSVPVLLGEMRITNPGGRRLCT